MEIKIENIGERTVVSLTGRLDTVKSVSWKSRSCPC